MERLSDERLRDIATSRGVTYEVVEDPDPLIVHTRMARAFPLGQEAAFDAFADPMSHVPLFEIIKGSTPPIRAGIERILPHNQFFAFEHVEEGNLPPRLMLVRYTLDRPYLITKEAVTDPFMIPGDEVLDKKKGKVRLRFERINDAETTIIAESEFQAVTGAIFARGFVDHVWLNFFENVMLASGMITSEEFLTNR